MKRFWCPRDGVIRFGTDGYLADPDPDPDSGLSLNPDSKSFQSIESTNCLGLLGEPGIGKSFAIKLAFEAVANLPSQCSTDAMFVDLHEYGDETRLIKDIFESEKFISWLSGTHTLHIFLDSLDECSLLIRNVAPIFLNRFEKCKAQLPRLFVRFACRTVRWPESFERGFPELWGEHSVGVYELAPLRRKDVITAAIENQLDGDAFLDEIALARVEPLAIKPVTLAFLISIYRNTERLPASQLQLYQDGCLRLLDESSIRRRDSQLTGELSAAMRILIASYIAALMIFCRKSAIRIRVGDSTRADDILEAVELEGVTLRMGGVTLTLGASEIMEVIDTGIFTSRGANLYGFAHHTYAEFLAARYLVNSGIDHSNLMKVIQSTDEARHAIVPQLEETAAWMASMDSTVFQDIMDIDPQVLLRSDVAKSDEKDREQLVTSLLRLLEAEQINASDWNLLKYFPALRHANITRQLMPYVIDRTKPRDVRCVAIDIAAECKVQDLQTEMVNRALDTSEDYRIRNLAARAVTKMADSTTKNKLRPLVLSSSLDDPLDELKGHALQALWPDQLSTQEVFANLSPPKKDHYFGSYFFFLHEEFVPNLGAADIPVALDWITRLPATHELALSISEQIDRIFALAWQYLADPGVLNAMAVAIASRLEKHDPVSFAKIIGDTTRPEPECDTKRHSLLKAILSIITDIDVHAFELARGRPGLINSSDLVWMLDEINAEPSATQAKQLTALLRAILDWKSSSHMDALLQAVRTIPVIADRYDWLVQTVVLGSPEAKKMKSDYEAVHAHRSPESEQIKIVPPPSERVVNWLARIETGEIDGWWMLVRDMTLEESSTHYRDEFQPDLTKLPGWIAANVETRARIINAAKKYLQERTDLQPETWLGKDVFNRPAAGGFKALLLLMEFEPAFISQLPEERWATWGPTVLNYLLPLDAVHVESQQQALVRSAYKMAARPLIDALLILIDKDNRDHGHLFVLRRVINCWDDELCCALLRKTTDVTLTPLAVRNLLKALLTHGCAEAKAHAESLITIPIPIEKSDRARAMAGAVALLACADDAGWSAIWSAVNSDTEFGKQVMEEVAHNSDDKYSGRLSKRLVEDDAADLYVWLAENFPHSEDPDIEKAHVVSGRESVALFRNSILTELASRGTRGSLMAVKRIRDACPDLDWMYRVVLEARSAAARNLWQPIAPEQLLTLTTRPNSYLVRSPGELLSALIESVKNLERKLQGETPAAKFLWNDIGDGTYRPRDENDVADYVKLHLEEDLKQRGVVALREVQIRRGQGGGTGERTDIHITGLILGREDAVFDRVRVIIEVKSCWHSELKTAMQTQLVDRYLKNNQCQHGLYLVCWHRCEQWDPEDYRIARCPDWTLDEARAAFDDRAKRLSEGRLSIKAFVLNVALR